MRRKQTMIVIILAVTAMIGTSALFLFYPRNKVPNSYTYSCYYDDSWSYARCVNKDDTRYTCYGYYDLAGTRPEDGIIPNSSDSSTCEALAGEAEFYYDQNGNFIDTTTTIL